MYDFSDREFVLASISQNRLTLQFAHEDLKKDKEFVLATVTQNGYALEFAHDNFKKDREIVLIAVTRAGDALEFAHEDLKNNEEFLYEVDLVCKIEPNSNIFEYINDRIQIKIKENPDYLLEFEPIYIKPVRY